MATYRLNVKGEKKIFHVSGNQKKALLISFKNRLSQNSSKKQKVIHYMVIKWSIHQEDTTLIDMYAC